MGRELKYRAFNSDGWGFHSVPNKSNVIASVIFFFNSFQGHLSLPLLPAINLKFSVLLIHTHTHTHTHQGSDNRKKCTHLFESESTFESPGRRMRLLLWQQTAMHRVRLLSWLSSTCTTHRNSRLIWVCATKTDNAISFIIVSTNRCLSQLAYPPILSFLRASGSPFLKSIPTPTNLFLGSGGAHFCFESWWKRILLSSITPVRTRASMGR